MHKYTLKRLVEFTKTAESSPNKSNPHCYIQGLIYGAAKHSYCVGQCVGKCGIPRACLGIRNVIRSLK
jgi:hypothetical protein